MEDYPRTQIEFDARFTTEEACRAYVARLRWPTGFSCLGCGGKKAWPVRTLLRQCAGCGSQTSVRLRQAVAVEPAPYRSLFSPLGGAWLDHNQLGLPE